MAKKPIIVSGVPTDGQTPIWRGFLLGWKPETPVGGGGSWGTIGGTLSDQTDLQGGLDGKEDVGVAAGLVTAHEGAGDPHTVYLTEVEADALYDSVGAAAAAVASHEAAGDPHPGYLTAAEGNAAYQPLDSDLTTLAASITAAGHALVDDASASAQRTTLGLEIGVNVQAQDAELAAIAGLTSAADRLPYFTGLGTAALATFTGQARNLLDDVDAAAQRATLDAQQLDATLTALAGLNSTAGLVEQTGADAFTKRLIGAANATDIPTRADGDTRYQERDEKNAASGYPGLSAGSIVDPTQLGTGSAITTKFLRGDSTWQTIAGGGDMLAANNLSDVADVPTARSNLAAAPLASPTFTGTVTLPTIAAGSASAASWPVHASGTLLTAPEKGAIEHDTNCLYFTTDVGNRGYVPVRHFIRCNATRTLPNDTNENAIFNSPTNGRLTLETGTYKFEGIISVSAMSATSGNALIDIIGAGTAVTEGWMWQAWGRDNSSATAAATVTGSFTVTQQSVASIVSVGVGTGLQISVRGTFEVTTAGTVIPSIDQVNAAAGVVAIGSYMMFERMGAANVVSVGQWD